MDAYSRNLKIMKKQVIEIEVPDGKKAVWKDGKVVFEDIKLKLPKTWEVFCNNYKIQEGEYYISSDSDIEAIQSRIRLRYGDSNVLPNKQAAEAHLALIKLHQLRDCYRQGWVPDYNNISDKFCINRYFDYYSHKHNYEIIVRIANSYFLSFQSKEIAQEFLNNFRDLIEQAGDLI